MEIDDALVIEDDDISDDEDDDHEDVSYLILFFLSFLEMGGCWMLLHLIHYSWPLYL